MSVLTKSKLHLLEKEQKIDYAKLRFEEIFKDRMDLYKVSSPAFVEAGVGVQDFLNGIETPIEFSLKNELKRYEFVHSLAKWKRSALSRFELPVGKGIVTDMRAFRPDEEDLTTGIHSVYVDQWDWEKVIDEESRNLDFLKAEVIKIYSVIYDLEQELDRIYGIPASLPREITFVHSEELLDLYPNLSSKERENAYCKDKGAIFVIGIGGIMKDGKKHDGRSPDYDDWSTETSKGFHGLNGDIIVWHPERDSSFELSSMGIRVDAESLTRQCLLNDCESYLDQPWHKSLLEARLPQSIGGGIGQSRMMMFFLKLKHIGEVQYGAWSDELIKRARLEDIELL